MGEGAPRERLHRFLDLYLDLDRRVRLGEQPPIAVFSDVRALSEPNSSPVWKELGGLYQKVATLFEGPGFEWLDPARRASPHPHADGTGIFWSAAWLPRYDVEDYQSPGAATACSTSWPTGWPRRHGLIATRPVSARLGSDAKQGAPETSRETFLLAATRLINQLGYRGASVEKISALLNVTKGSFYHHNDAKDDLVVTCFERSFDMVRRVQSAAMQSDADQWTQLSSVARTLVEHQLSDQGPLLRTSALSALPEPIRRQMVEGSNRLSERFAAMISDGVADGSIRAVDRAQA